MHSKLHRSFNDLLRTSALAVIGLIAFAPASQSAFAQATYYYSGNHYTTATLNFTGSMSVTATLQLASWLPANQNCINAGLLPGFHLVMNDGINAYDTWNQNRISGRFFVSTDSQGNISLPWNISLTQYFPNQINGVFTVTSIHQVFPNTIPYNASCYSTPYPNPPANIDFAVTDGYAAVNSAGVWSRPSSSALAAMLINRINLEQIGAGSSLSDQLAQIATDISTNNGYACSDLASLARAVTAQTGKKITADQSAFILQTVAIMESELGCG